MLTAINPGEGFWVNAKEASSITINGMFEYGTLELTSGWNLVGLEDGQAVSVAAMVEAHPAIISLWKWAKGTWEVYLPDEPVLVDMHRARGLPLLIWSIPDRGSGCICSNRRIPLGGLQHPPLVYGESPPGPRSRS